MYFFDLMVLVLTVNALYSLKRYGQKLKPGVEALFFQRGSLFASAKHMETHQLRHILYSPDLWYYWTCRFIKPSR